MNHSDVFNHLWQSTLFAAAAAILTLVLRRNSARTRYAVWLAASIKFAIPFSVLVALGKHFAWTRATTTVAKTEFFPMVERFGRPFVSPVEPAQFTAAHVLQIDLTSIILSAIWILGVACVAIQWYRWARRVRIALRAAVPFEFDALIPVLLSPTRMEPGVVGIFCPVLLMPQGVIECLTPQQLAAVVAHECCHVRRCDNLTAAFHVCVQAVFWFHPLVWYIGHRLMEERERACDEEVVRMGTAPETYVEGILNVCKTCVESPLMSVSGVTGANLKKRIEDIMTRSNSCQLDLVRKVMLVIAVAAAVAGPIVTGLLNPSVSFAQTNKKQYTFGLQTSASKTFEVASVKENRSGSDGWQLHPPASGGIVMDNMELRKIIASSFRIQDSAVIGPAWLDSVRYDIVAKGADPKAENPVVMEMMRALLVERFQLKYHVEQREKPIYAMVIAKGGHKLTRPEDGMCAAEIKADRHCANLRFSPYNVGITNMPLEAIIGGLARVLQDRPIINKTALPGFWDVDVSWSPGESRTPGQLTPTTVNGVDIGAMMLALEEQAGLKLEATRGPVDFLVIDSIQKADTN